MVDASGAPNSQPKALPIGFRIARMSTLRPIMSVITPRSVIERSLRQSVSNQSVATPAEIDEYWELLRYPGNREATGKRFAQFSSRFSTKPVGEATREVPALILWGDEDKLIPVSSANWFASTYKNSRTQIYKGIGHLPMEENPDQSAADVRNWLGRPAASAK